MFVKVGAVIGIAGRRSMGQWKLGSGAGNMGLTCAHFDRLGCGKPRYGKRRASCCSALVPDLSCRELPPVCQAEH